MLKNYLFLDTETTGFKKSGALVQEGQGRVCQVAMILADETGKILSQMSTLIRPAGWTIQAGAQRIHGITDQDCEVNGVPQEDVISFYNLMINRATAIVAHNSNFDQGMMDVECAYHGSAINSNIPWSCTMLENKHINNGKWPKLDLTYKHYTGKDLSGAHDAMVDTRACMEIFFAMRGIIIV
jgi:DNA polymerase-3 subunit epsilon